jgi:uncharacterized protein (TIGR03437 family)
MRLLSRSPLVLGIAVSLTPLSWAQTQTFTASYNGLPVFIATDGADIVSYANIVVPQALKVTNLTVRLQIEYPNVADLEVYLFSPLGTRVVLLDNNCSNLVNVDTTFDDAAPQYYKDFCPAEAGRGPFRANEPLSNVYGDSSSFGTWRIFIENNSSDSRSGWFTAASLNITGTRVVAPTIRQNTVVNEASFGPGGIAPGEIISIFGVGLGPATPVAAPAGALPTSLSGVTVTFNGTAVPISYASAYRLDVQAPTTLTSGGTVSIQVNYNNASSTVVTPVTQDTAPGVYTLQSGGQGQVKAVNLSNNRLNSIASPAPKGSSIIIYASGLGAVNPAVPAGQVTPNSPTSATMKTDVAASIGGVPAAVMFAGLAPGGIGLYQLNIQVPQGAPAGAQELIISTGGNPSQSGATVYVQ